MEKFQIILIGVSLIGLLGLGLFAYALFQTPNSSAVGVRGMMSSGGGSSAGARRSRESGVSNPVVEEQLSKFSTKRVKPKKQKEDLAQKLFRAGLFAPEERKKFVRKRVITFVGAMIIGPLFFWMLFESLPMLLIGIIFGALIGYTLPITGLERRIRSRDDETMYFLPLVIEQVSIGVSSSLDIGPCITNITGMARERGTLNPVIEMFMHVEKLIKSGLSLEDALIDVGEASGSMEVKHSFMFLSQCSKHGGEISKQLQELAESVTSQRQVRIEAKIAALPVKATLPLVVIFGGFFAILFSGLVVRMLSVFKGVG